MRKIRIYSAIVCSLLSTSLQAVQIRVLTEHLPPYQIDEGNKAGGFATELVRQIFQGAGIGYQIEFQSWSRAYQLAQRDDNTCIYSISKSAERVPLFQWIGELSYNTTAIYALKSRDDIKLTSLADAKKYVTAVTRDDVTHHYLLKHGFAEGQQLYMLENVATMLNVLAGRKENIDLVIINDTILKYRAQESGLRHSDFKKLLELHDLPLDFHLACSPKTAAPVVAKLRASLLQMKNDGRFAAITAGWSERLR